MSEDAPEVLVTVKIFSAEVNQKARQLMEQALDVKQNGKV
jgi:hypothetical protein